MSPSSASVAFIPLSKSILSFMLNATLSSPVNLGFPLFVVNFGLTIIQWSHALPFPPSCTSITNSFIPLTGTFM